MRFEVVEGLLLHRYPICQNYAAFVACPAKTVVSQLNAGAREIQTFVTLARWVS